MSSEAAIALADARARRLAGDWGLTLGPLLPHASCARVFEAGEFVLKVPYADVEEAASWPASEAFAAHGGTPILRSDPSTGAILMPRLRPGTMLAEAGLGDLDALDICADLILRMREAPLAPGIPLETWYRQLEALPSGDLVEKARAVYADLVPCQSPSVLLHGDFHHFNILRHGDEWLAIDPKGLVGDPAFEIVGFMRNPDPGGLNASMMAARLERFAKRLANPIDRLWGWAFTETVLCADSPTEAWSAGCERAARALW